MSDLFPRSKKRDTGDLNIVPILDMFVCVIFFLLLGTSFTHLTKLTLPPSSVSTSSDPVQTPPLSPRLAATAHGDRLQLILSWEGATPGQMEEMVDSGDAAQLNARQANADQSRNIAAADANEAHLRAVVAKMIGDFSAQHPNEKVLKLGMGADVPYQHLVSIMDGARDKMSDLVLFSYAEAEKRGP